RGRPLKLPWELELGEPFHAENSELVAPAFLEDGTEVVVKVQLPDDAEGRHEPEALSFWGGEGAGRLLAHDAEHRAMLLERAKPGTPLGTDYDEVALEVVACALERLWRPPPGDVEWRRIDDVAAHWTAVGELLPTQGELVLCHQDLHG